MPDTVGIGVHGAGWVSTEHMKAFLADPRARVVAISSRNLESCFKHAHEAGLKANTYKCYGGPDAYD